MKANILFETNILERGCLRTHLRLNLQEANGTTFPKKFKCNGASVEIKKENNVMDIFIFHPLQPAINEVFQQLGIEAQQRGQSWSQQANGTGS